SPMRVEFTVEERCIPSESVTCAPSQLTSSNAGHWPDVPFDQICTSSSSCPNRVSPTFFTRKRLSAVTTKVRVGSSYQPVDEWNLMQGFPTMGDGTSPTLWLESIERKGVAEGQIALPKNTFHGVQMANRVDSIGDLGPRMNRYRISSITTESGAVLSVNYSTQDCTTANLPSAPDTNTRRCFPVMWTPEGQPEPIQEYFHKYLVTSVVANG